MNRATFSAGAVVEIDGRSLQMLRQVSDSVWQLEDERTKRVQEYDNKQLRTLYAAGQLVFVPLREPEQQKRERLMPAVSEETLEKAKLKRLYAKAVIDLPVTEQAFKAAIERQWANLKSPEAPPHWTTVYRWRKKYIKAGEDFLALQDAHHQKGNRKERFPREVTEFAEKAVEEKYLQKERRTQQDTLDYAAALVVEENKLRPKLAQLPLPSRRLINRLVAQLPAYDRVAARYGRLAATKRFRGVHGHRTTDAPLERAEIDHTQLDLMVIDDETLLPLGRPWLTACADDHTRNILGLCVSFEPPSYLTVARCLKHAFMPKTTLHEEYPSIVSSWNAHGVMRELVVDNGAEFHSASLENACYSLGIELHYSARKTPWFKGKIERFMGTLNRGIAHGNPGTTFENIFEKDEYDPSKMAVIRYSKFKEIIFKWVADVYHQKPHRALGKPPAVMWEESIEPEEIQVPADPARLDAILGRSETRRLTHKGIELDGLLYNCPELTDLRRRFGEAMDVEVRVDNADLGEIVVISPEKGNALIKVPALRADYARGLTEWQHRVCKRYAARELQSYSPNAWLEAKLHIARLIDQEFMHKKQSTRTRIARFKETKVQKQESAPEATPVPALGSDAVQPPTTHEQSSKSAPVAPLVVPRAKDGPKRFKPVYRNRSATELAAELVDEDE